MLCARHLPNSQATDHREDDSADFDHQGLQTQRQQAQHITTLAQVIRPWQPQGTQTQPAAEAGDSDPGNL